MEKEQGGKRSLALPITLLILVMSVMGNVLLYTKNIEYSRGQTAEDGLAVFTGLEMAAEELRYWIRHIDEVSDSKSAKDGTGRRTAVFLGEALERGQGHLSGLFDKAGKLDEPAFGKATDSYIAYIDKHKELLAEIGANSGPITDAEQSALVDMKTSFQELEALLSEFHYAGADNRNVLIRLAGGHDWLPIAEKILAAVKK